MEENIDQEETKQDQPNESESQKEIEKLTATLNQVSGELNTIKANVEKRKSETTTLKILFYTGLTVLFFGFIYTNQTLQRAQFNNLEANISALQSRVNHTLLSLEKQLHEEIMNIENKVGGNPESKVHESLSDMNLALSALRPETEATNRLIKKVQKDSQELRDMLHNQKGNIDNTPEPVP